MSLSRSTVSDDSSVTDQVLLKNTPDVVADIDKEIKKERELMVSMSKEASSDTEKVEDMSIASSDSASAEFTPLKHTFHNVVNIDEEINTERELMIKISKESNAGICGTEESKVKQHVLTGASDSKISEIQAFNLDGFLKVGKLAAADNDHDRYKSRKRAYQAFAEEQEDLAKKRCKIHTARSQYDDEEKRRKKQIYLYKQELYKQLVEEQKQMSAKTYNTVDTKDSEGSDISPLTFYTVSTILAILLALCFSYWVNIIFKFL